MDILVYNELNYGKLKKAFDKVTSALAAGDFKSAEVKKMPNTGYYRAKLDDTNRLIFKFVRSAGQTYLLMVEVIFNHAYEKSRFLSGVPLKENEWQPLSAMAEVAAEDILELPFVNPQSKRVHILDKIISFDPTQDDIFALPNPLIIIGAAGSGKTALTLEKLKNLSGQVLYTTLSNYLVENSQNLYRSFNYENEGQEVDFLSFQDYISSLRVAKGREIDYRVFEQWIWRYKQSHKIKDSYKIYEEFKGVITGNRVDTPYLSKSEYLKLGIRQSIFSDSERELIYDLFEKYLAFLKEGQYYDSNILAYEYQNLVRPKYDFVVIDEVQDITNVQLFLILKSLKNAQNFILCGDSNQIVHPNFFSWANIKTLFYQQDMKGNIMRILATNYRNTPEVTGIANKLLLVKNARFGAIDKESNYLVQSNSKHKGEVAFFENQAKTNADFNQRTRNSARFAVIVMRNEDKITARKYFQTPLLFSIHEVKGLEYENIILFDMISTYEAPFRELTQGVTKADLTAELTYSRAKDKSDKSLDEYKFYVNALYVAITRAVKNLYVIERNKKHALLELLDLTNFSSRVALQEQNSTSEEWQREAQKLEKQGKAEQAAAIRAQILKIQPTPWEPVTIKNIDELITQALNPEHFNKKAKDRLLVYALMYQEDGLLEALSQLKYRPADENRQTQELIAIHRNLYEPYKINNLKVVQENIRKYGVDYRNEINQTPFDIAVWLRAFPIAKALLAQGANPHTISWGVNALQILLDNRFNDDNSLNLPCQQFLEEHYHIFKQESLRLQIGDKLIKISAHQGEYLMLHAAISYMTNQILGFIMGRIFYFTANFFIKSAESLPASIMPVHRKKRAYISAMLAKNEINSTQPYNKQIFMRVDTGYYIINPTISIEIDGQWHNIYRLNMPKMPTTQYAPNFGKLDMQIKKWQEFAEKSNKN